MQTRAITALILTRIIKDRISLSIVLAENLSGMPNKKDNAFIQELCFGVMRWYQHLDFIFHQLIDKKLREKDTDIKMLLLCGLYQLEKLTTPDHAAVSATVEACKDLGKPWATRLINAILRRYIRERSQIQNKIEENAEAKYAHPQWLLTILQEDWPQQWKALIKANNQYPPMYIRVNKQKTTRSQYIDLLHKIGLESEATPYTDYGLLLKQAVNVNQLPGFDDGLASVQDLSAQLAAALLDLTEGQRVLDACAAPGGKTTHILEYQEALNEVVAIDHDNRRIEKLENNLHRLGFKATLHVADACTTENWWDGSLFDRILIDAPCSATGVIRRHPDIKVLRHQDGIDALLAKQYKLLCSLWPILKQRGKLLYVTCSVLARENMQQIERFLFEHADCRINQINAKWGNHTPFGTQILTGNDNMDGFFYACLEKT
jgi:16S rRNA (cytosine967-C5)-methyltransferase